MAYLGHVPTSCGIRMITRAENMVFNKLYCLLALVQSGHI
jgi:hypothetical protein